MESLFSLSSTFITVTDIRALHSFPTRRSSDLNLNHPCGTVEDGLLDLEIEQRFDETRGSQGRFGRCSHHRGNLLSGAEYFRLDRKSTRLNSSHVASSYAVFCLKKKKHR